MLVSEYEKLEALIKHCDINHLPALGIHQPKEYHIYFLKRTFCFSSLCRVRLYLLRERLISQDTHLEKQGEQKLCSPSLCLSQASCEGANVTNLFRGATFIRLFLLYPSVALRVGGLRFLKQAKCFYLLLSQCFRSER